MVSVTPAGNGAIGPRGFRPVLAAIAGAIAGWALMSSPLAAIVSPTRVTWDATTCPAGVYTVTSTARDYGGGTTYEAITPNVRLPRPSFVQEFHDLPTGSYSVTAIARRSDGQTFGSDTQTLTNFVGMGSSGHQRAAPSELAGAVQPPSTPVTRSTTSRVANVPQPAPSPSPAASRRAPPGVTIDDLSRLMDGGAGWRRFDAVDTDADGRIDLVVIELANGDVWIWDVRAGGGPR